LHQTGTKAKHLAKTFLPVVARYKEANTVSAAQTIPDFMYHAHMPEISKEDLEALKRDWAEFQEVKEIFGESRILDTQGMFDEI
jgi:hypothetical protein